MTELLKLAESELGYLEKSKEAFRLYGANCLYDKEKYAGADNVTKYSYELYQRGLGHPEYQPWCQTFIAWLYWKIFGAELANKLLCGKLRSASTMDVKDAFFAQGRGVPLNKAKPGDIAYRSRNGGGHVGLVVGRASNGKIISIEGNSSASDITSWNGGAVVKHTGASWEWCVRPDYTLVDYHWVEDNGTWYYQNGLGQNRHGWDKIKETQGDYYHWYWFDSKGAMATNSREIDGSWYFFQPDGPLEGAQCITDSNGALNVWSMSE